MARRRRYRGTPVPPLHAVLIYVTGLMIILSGIAYYFAPPDKSGAFQLMMASGFTFLCGKFSNGFGKPMVPAQFDTDGDEDGDGETKGERA